MTTKIAIFIPSLGGGGAERVMGNLAAGFSERGFAVDLVLAQAKGPYLADVPPSVRIVDLKKTHILACLYPLVKYLRAERPAVLLSAMTHTNIVAIWGRALAGGETRLVVSERSNLSSDIDQNIHRRARLLPMLVRHFYDQADAITAVSHGVASDLASVAKLPSNRIDVIYNPSITPRLLAMAEQPVEHPWLATKTLPVILGAGRLTLQKDFPTLIHAYHEVKKSIPSRLIIIGEGRQRAELEQLVKDLDLQEYVSLPGFATNPYAYMKRANVFVLSSAWEGFPNALVEAMGCGVPVVSTDCPDGPREILNDGQYGPLVPIGDVEQMARAIIQTLEASIPASNLQERAAQFRLDNIIDQYLSILLPSLVKEKPVTTN